MEETRNGDFQKPLRLGDELRAAVRQAAVHEDGIDTEEMKAINLPHFKLKLKDLSKDLFLEHGWDLPDGFKDKALRDHMTFKARRGWMRSARCA